MKHGRRSSINFSLALTGWACLSVVSILVCLAIVLRLDVAFLESQGMIKNDDLRDALYMRATEIEPAVFWLLGMSIAAVAGISYIFSRSQFGYFARLHNVLEVYASTGQVPAAGNLGQFSPYVLHFLEIAAMRTRQDNEDKLDAAIELARKGWPSRPRIHWFDQAQFLCVAALLAVFFNVACIIFYLQASSRVVALANSLVRFSRAEAPYFFTAQFEIVTPLMWTILLMASIAFLVTSFKVGRRFSEANYAILRDLGKFMEGDLDKRLFLRTDDPGRELVEPLNHSLDRIAGQIRAHAMPESRVTPIRPGT